MVAASSFGALGFLLYICNLSYDFKEDQTPEFLPAPINPNFSLVYCAPLASH